MGEPRGRDGGREMSRLSFLLERAAELAIVES